MKDKVVIAISGGVDSSVAALLLKEQGHEVVGITMCLGVAAEEGGRTKCCGPREIEDARRVCQMLEIPHYIMDFSGDLEEHIVKPFIEEYARGRTPNPCVACNRHIKFGTLLDKVTAMGFDFIATGHYARVEEKGGRSILSLSKETRKDQTYFLHAIKRETLDRIRFPLADLTKEEVRQIARKHRLPVSDKQESQDICFIPEEGYGAFLRTRSIDVKPGEFVDSEGEDPWPAPRVCPVHAGPAGKAGRLVRRAPLCAGHRCQEKPRRRRREGGSHGAGSRGRPGESPGGQSARQMPSQRSAMPTAEPPAGWPSTGICSGSFLTNPRRRSPPASMSCSTTTASFWAAASSGRS